MNAYYGGMINLLRVIRGDIASESVAYFRRLSRTENPAPLFVGLVKSAIDTKGGR